MILRGEVEWRHSRESGNPGGIMTHAIFPGCPLPVELGQVSRLGTSCAGMTEIDPSNLV